MKLKKTLLGILFALFAIGGSVVFYTTTHKKYTVIPVFFSSKNIPCVEVTIEGKPYFLSVDSGSDGEISLTEEIIENIKNKTFYKNGRNFDIKGNAYPLKKYFIPQVELKGLKFSDVVIKTTHPEYLQNTVFYTNPKEEIEDFLPNPNICPESFCDDKKGLIGLSILQKVNLLLDFPNSKIYACERNIHSPESILGKSFAKIQIPFIFENHNTILFPIATDLGTLNFMLDTGFTASFIRTSLVDGKEYVNEEGRLPFYTSTKFKIGSHDFFTKRLYLLEFHKSIYVFDGILGMDFLKNHIVFIDFEKQILHIGL